MKTALFLIAILAACHKPAPSVVASSAAAPAPAGTLPAIAGFDAGPEERGAGFARRRYRRDGVETTVTLAGFPMDKDGYAGWLRMSREAYPQAQLEVSDADGNGFYQCAANAPERCDLLVQLRCGLHVEIRAPGSTRRTDADAIARALDLARRARDCDTQRAALREPDRAASP